MLRASVSVWLIVVLAIAGTFVRPVKSEVLLDEQFSTDVITSGSWSASDASVSVNIDSGWLRIGSDLDTNDFAEKFGLFQLPIVIEWRERTLSGAGSVYSLPKLEFWWSASPGDNYRVTYVDNNDGWLFGQWTNIKTLGTTDWGQWRRVRAIIRSDGGKLYAKEDNDPDFTLIISKTWNVAIPSVIEKIRLSQHTDDSSDFDYIRIEGACCIGLRGDPNGDGNESNIVDLNYAVNRIFRNGPPAICFEEGNPNGDGTSLNILDLNYFVNRIFRGGPLPVSCPF